jgi:hypothetical protein
MIQKQFDQALKAGRRRSLSALAAIRGLMGMNGGTRFLNIGTPLWNIKLIFYAVRNALWKFMKKIKKNM